MKCIFCLQEKEASDEHVMPKALGGNLISRDVCKECNSGLSQLDQSLTDHSLLVMPRLVEQPDAIWGMSAHMASEKVGRDLEVRLGHQFAPEMKVQLFFSKIPESENYQISASGGSAELYRSFFKVLKKQLKKKSEKQIPIIAPLDENKPGEFRLIMNRSTQIAFRPSSKNADVDIEYKEMIGLIVSKIDELETKLCAQAEIAPVGKVDQPNLKLNIKVDFGRNLRAVSKIAYTFLAKQFGPDIVLHKDFDVFRSYILSDEGANETGSIWWNGDNKESSLGSSRYAIWLKEYKERVPILAEKGTHLISIAALKDRHIVFLEFYNEVTYAVDVGKLPDTLLVPCFHEFDYVNRQNRPIPPDQLVQKLIKKLQ